MSGLNILQRDCGSCTACCTHIETSEPSIAHEAHVDCKHLKYNARSFAPGYPAHRIVPMPGCGSYESRPESCRAFKCAWLEGVGDDEARPDRSGVMFFMSEDSNAMPYMVAAACREGALDIGTPARDAANEAGFATRVLLQHFDGTKQLIAPAHMQAAIERGDIQA